MFAFDITNLVAFSDRKYFWSTCSSKMSDNEHPFPVLGNAEILRVKNLPLAVIPKFIQRTEDDLKGIPFVVAEESFDVLK